MLPFDLYPNGGRDTFHVKLGYNTRISDGPVFMQKTSQTKCAYCDADFTKSYETWLTMVLDHVVPASVCDKLGLPLEWCEDFSNMALSCAACNGFCNRYTFSVEVIRPVTLQSFYDLRDTIFAERKELIGARHKIECDFFNSRPWEIPPTPSSQII